MGNAVGENGKLTRADKCLNYKSPNFEEELTKVCNDEVDIYFDNVAGEILDSMIPKLKQHGVIVACGGVSGYNDKKPTVFKSESLSKRGLSRR